MTREVVRKNPLRASLTFLAAGLLAASALFAQDVAAQTGAISGTDQTKVRTRRPRLSTSEYARSSPVGGTANTQTGATTRKGPVNDSFTVDHPGDVLVDSYELAIPAETPPGDYAVVIGLYQEASGARLPVMTAEVEHDGDSVTIGTLRVR